MKNFKKVIALVLAFAMTASMALTASAADFTDAADIDNTVAVDVMSGVGVINGYTDGSFGPDKTVSRAEMAKMLYTVLKGEKDPSLYAGSCPFTDFTDNTSWAKGYVGYAASLGIIAGTSESTFNPAGEVTGYEAMKIWLGALGYKSEYEEYTGALWIQNVVDDAETAGLDAGFADGFDYYAPLTRDGAVLMMMNAMEATMVSYSNISYNLNGDVVGYDVNYVAAAAGAGYDGEDDGEKQLCEKYFSDLKKTTDEDAFGRVADVWTYVDEDEETVTLASTPVAADVTYVVGSEDTLAAALTAADEDLVLADDAEWALNGAEADDVEGTAEVSTGYTLEITLNDDDEASYIVAYKYEMATISKVSAASSSADYDYLVSLDGVGSYKDTAIEGFDAKTMVADDEVVIVKGASAILYMAEPKVVTGEVTSYSTSNGTISVDGVKYTVYADVTVTDATIGDEYDISLDPNGYVMGFAAVSDDSEAELAYLYVSDAEYVDGQTGLMSGADPYGAAEVTFMNGAEDVVALYVAEDDDVWYYYTTATESVKTALEGVVFGDVEAPEEGFYSYTVEDDMYILSALDTTIANEADSVTTVAGSATVTTGVTDFAKANSSTVLSVVEDGTVATYTGISNFPDQTFAAEDITGALVLKDEDATYLSNIIVLGASVSVTDTVYGYLYEEGDTTSAGDELCFYVDGEAVVYYNADDHSGYSAGNVYAITVDEDGVITADGTAIETTATVAETDAAFITLANGTDLYYTDDTVVYNVSGDLAGAEGVIAADDAIIYVVDETDLVVVYIVDAPEVTTVKAGETALDFDQVGTLIVASSDEAVTGAITVDDETVEDGLVTVNGYTYTVNTDAVQFSTPD